jgi:hypothetical protein
MQIRVWKLGSLEHRILPNDAAFDKLETMLSGWDGKSDLDVLWGPDLQCQVVDVDLNGVSFDAIQTDSGIKLVNRNKQKSLRDL